MKRIVFTVTNDLTYDRRMQRICTALAVHGYQVLLIGRQLPNSLPLQPAPYQQERITCKYHKGKLFYLEYNYRLWQRLRREPADIFSAVDLDTIIPNFVVAGRMGKKRVYDAHEYFSEVPEVVNRPMVKRIWEKVAQVYIPKADAAYTVGECLAGIFQERYGIPFETIRNVPDLQPNNLPPAGKYLLYQGALNMGRGLEQLIQAMHQINIPLKIAGEGDLSTQLRQMVKDQGLENKIEFLGFVKPIDLPTLTAGALLGLNLLQPLGLSYYYSLANKYFDYIQAGVPTLNMDFPEYRQLNERYHTGLLLADLNPDLIAQTINQLVSDPTLYKSLSENCLLAKTELNWQKEQQKLLKLYSEL